MSLSENEKRDLHWHVKIKPSVKKKALVFIAENGITDQSEFTEKAFSYYLDEQEKKIETNIEMN